MNFKISSMLLVVLATFIIYGDEVGAVSSADIKKKITAKNAYLYIGIGGRYGRLVDTVSKDKIIESDHFPLKSVYEHAKDKHIREIAERDMAACSISFAEHRNLLTTGSGTWKAAYFNQWLKDMFQKGDYNEAISMNIKLYEEHGFLNQVKKGVIDGLSVHVANKLITGAQRDALIKLYALEGYDKKLEQNKDRKEAEEVVHKS